MAVPNASRIAKGRFKNLPTRLQRRWWEGTAYGKHPATNELLWTIEALDPELAEYLALGDAERTKQTIGEKKISDQANKQRRPEETRTLFAAMHATAVCADMVKVIIAWRRGNLVPRWEVPALRTLCKDFDPPDTWHIEGEQ
jgi:hypothetical protein